MTETVRHKHDHDGFSMTWAVIAFWVCFAYSEKVERIIVAYEKSVGIERAEDE